MPSTKVVRAISDFERWVTARAELPNNMIIEHNYIKARAKLERLMENI